MITANVTGVSAVRRRIGKVTEATVDAVNDAAIAEARETLADELELVPFLTGELFEGIEVWVERLDGNVTAYVGIRDAELFWAVFIEWGRSSAEAQPFATPASEQTRRRWPKRADKAARQALRR